MSEKKVIAVIVEGPSEEAALGTIFKEYFSGDEIQFVVVHGDITSEDYSSLDNIVKKINELIDGVKQRYGYNVEDFLQIIHIADTDGAFTRGKVVYADVDHVQYYEDRIEAKNVDSINRRNDKKAEILFKLYTTGKINEIRYRIYYNSCNLEHVLFNELKNHSNDEKEEMADEFAERYEGKVEEFIEFISDEAYAVPGTYRETWRFIEKDDHSLKRHTNMQLIFK
jgi:hypothetical protein